jgi:hypothetical protein
MKKPIVKEIKTPNELKAILSDKNKSKLAKINAIKKYVGFCCKCNDMPTKMVCYDVGDGAQLVERYCDKHGPN